MSSNGPWNNQIPMQARPGMDPGARRVAVWAAMIILALGGITTCSLTGGHESAADQLARCEKTAAASYSADYPHGLVALDPAHLPSDVTAAAFNDLRDGYNALPDGRGVYVQNGCALAEPTP